MENFYFLGEASRPQASYRRSHLPEWRPDAFGFSALATASPARSPVRFIFESFRSAAGKGFTVNEIQAALTSVLAIAAAAVELVSALLELKAKLAALEPALKEFLKAR
jgi:hypothetical protein